MPTVPSIADANRLVSYSPVSSTTNFNVTWPLFGNSNTEAKADLIVRIDGEDQDPDSFIFTGTAISGLTGIYNGGFVTLDTPVSSGRVFIYSKRLPRRVGYFLEGATLKFTTLDRLMDDFGAQMRDVSLHAQRATIFPPEDVDDEISTDIPKVARRESRVAGYKGTGAPDVSQHTLAEMDAAIEAFLSGGLSGTATYVERELTANEAIVPGDFFLWITKGSDSTHALPSGSDGWNKLFAIFNVTDFASTITGTFVFGAASKVLATAGHVLVVFNSQGTYYALYNGPVP